MYSKINTSFKKSHMIAGLLIPVFLYLVFRLIPTGAMAWLSLTEFRSLRQPPKFIGMDNFRHFFLRLNFQYILVLFQRTLVYAFSVAIIQNTIALLLALVLNSRLIRYKNFFRAVIFMPVVLGVTITVVIMSIVFNPISGPAAAVLRVFGARSDFFGDMKLAFPMIIGTHIWMYVGFSLVVYLAGLQSIPHELMESSYLDGSGTMQTFWYITLPLVWPTVVLSMTYTLLNTLQDYQMILLITGGNFNTMTLGMYMHGNAFGYVGHATTESKGLGYGAAVSLIMFVFVMIFTFGTRWILNKKEVDVQ